jgi:hypothetical protein
MTGISSRNKIIHASLVLALCRSPWAMRPDCKRGQKLGGTFPILAYADAAGCFLHYYSYRSLSSHRSYLDSLQSLIFFRSFRPHIPHLRLTKVCLVQCACLEKNVIPWICTGLRIFFFHTKHDLFFFCRRTVYILVYYLTYGYREAREHSSSLKGSCCIYPTV